MTRIAVVSPAGPGVTAGLAESIAAGAGARLVGIDARGDLSPGGWEVLTAARAIILGVPTDGAGPSWQFRRFAAAMAKPPFDRTWEDKLFAGFTGSVSSLGETLQTLDYLFQLTMELGGLWVGGAPLAAETLGGERRRPTWIGSLGTAVAQSLSSATAVGGLAVNLESGRQFGRQVAEAAARLEEWLRTAGMDRLKRGWHWH